MVCFNVILLPDGKKAEIATIFFVFDFIPVSIFACFLVLFCSFRTIVRSDFDYNRYNWLLVAFEHIMTFKGRAHSYDVLT